jgi:hypothetical protein
MINELMKFVGLEIEKKIQEEILSIEDRSDPYMNRERIKFKNGFGISIIRGETSYGGARGLFEIAPIGQNDDLNGSLIGLACDNVEGFLTPKEVIDRMLQISQL